MVWSIPVGWTLPPGFSISSAGLLTGFGLSTGIFQTRIQVQEQESQVVATRDYTFYVTLGPLLSSCPNGRRRLEQVEGVHSDNRMPPPPAHDASSCRGAPLGTLSQLALHSGWHAPGGHEPDAPLLPPPERLSPREAWRLRGGAVPRAHDAQPHVDGVCSALTCGGPFLVVVSLPSIVGVRPARSHCSAGHDFQVMVSHRHSRDRQTMY